MSEQIYTRIANRLAQLVEGIRSVRIDADERRELLTLVVRDRDGTVVFVEVRSRSRRDFGGAGASINAAKQRRIILTPHHYLMRLSTPPPCRFDAVLIDGETLQWVRAAFDAS